ncbi:hypothetical protein Scep_027271 [Stephania cephalantha]|uniref:Uncharacterized protein n=1 Tax=Stephania cephalantha TaxID=152367 RepID=A0AAP0E7T6_9MAGN
MGLEEEDNSRYKTGTKKCNCPFAINVKELPDSLWHVNLVCGQHNYDISIYLEGHSYVSRLNPDEKVVLQQTTKGNVKPHGILTTLKERDKLNSSTIRIIYNERAKATTIGVG